jgi:general secretion pathway protein G
MELSLMTAVVGILLAGCNAGHPKNKQVPHDFSALTNALEMYRLNAGRYPSTEQGLAALVTRPVTGPQPRLWTKIADRVPLDPWGQAYRYRQQAGAEPNTETFLLWSLGRDGQDGTADDIQSERPKPLPLPAQ